MWELAPILSSADFKWCVAFTNEYSRIITIYFLNEKSGIQDAFMLFNSQVELQMDHKIKILQCDGSEKFESLNLFSIILALLNKFIAQKNVLTERKHRYIVEMRLTLLAQAWLPTKFWDKAFLPQFFTLTYILPNTSSLEIHFSIKLRYSFLKPFSCLCYPFLKPFRSHKLKHIPFPYVFLGYNSHH